MVQGSSSNTSMPQERTFPAARKSASAFWSTMPGRAVLTTITPSFIWANCCGPNMWWVSSVRGRCTEMKSAMAQISSTSSSSVTPSAWARSGLQ